jgi:hypothetical protein
MSAPSAALGRSSDAQRFLALLPTEGDVEAASITVVTKWQATLKK